MKTNWFKRTLCSILVLVLVLGCVPVTAQAQDGQEASVSNDVTLEGSSSFGNLLTNTVNESQTPEADANYDGRICDLVIEGATATVEYTTPVEANLVVAIYDQDSGKMLGSGTVTVSPEETIAEVAIEIPVMPYYFSAGAYLLDAATNDPVSEEFKTDRYTKVMQDILAATVRDFDPELVLNLDDDDTTNFAVFNENTLRAEEGGASNQVTDNGDGTYTIVNADARFLAMQPGDTFTYTYPDGTMLIVNAASVSVKGTTVTVTDNPDADLSTVFDFVKIEEDSNGKEYTYDDSTLEDGLTVISDEEFAEGQEAVTFGLGIDQKGTIGTNFAISHTLIGEGNNHANVTISGSIAYSLTVKLKLYLSLDYQYISFSCDQSVSGSIAMTGKVQHQFSLGKFGIALCAGVYAYVDPSFAVEASGSVSFTFIWTGSAGQAYDSNLGRWSNTSSPSTMNTDLKVAGKFFIGIKAKLGIMAISEKILDLYVSGTVGGELSASKKAQGSMTPSGGEIHTCSICFEGEIDGVASLSLEFNIFGEFLKGKLTIAEGKLKITDIYYSVDYDEMARTKCPHKAYKTTVTALSQNRIPVQDVTIHFYQDNAELTDVMWLGVDGLVVKGSVPATDENGQTTVYLPKGSYTCKLSYNGKDYAKNFTVRDTSKSLEVLLDTVEQPGTGDIVDSGTYGAFLTWTLDSNGTLTISGSDSMPSTSAVPWENNRGQIKSVTIEQGVTSIGGWAFYNCSSLTSVTIPNSVTSIGDSAFYNCSRLTSVTIPDSVTSIGDQVFSGCSSLTGINVDPDNKYWCSVDGVLFSKDMKMLVAYPGGRAGAYKCPDGVTFIGDHAFSYCSRLTSVTIPNSVTSIGNSAFSYCSSLTSVTIPNSVTSIGNHAFSCCSRLTSVTIPNSVTSIGDQAFYHCNSLASVTIPDSVTSIGDHAFSYCSRLTSVTIPNSVTSIGGDAFYGCSSLTSVTIPNSVTSIGHSAFYGCSSLTSVTIPNSVTSIGDFAFYGCSSLKDVYYGGTEAQWSQIAIGDYNGALTNATIHCTDGDIAPRTLSEEAADTLTPETEAPTEATVPEVTEGTLPEVIEETEAAPEPIEESLLPVEEPLPEESAGEDEEELLLEEVSDRLWYSAPAGAEMTVVPVLQKLSAFTGAESAKNGIRSVKFTGLEPGEEYVLIVSLIPGSLVPRNLLYIDQDNAAADGTLSFTYIPRQDVSAQVRLCGIPAGRTVTLDREYLTMEAGTAAQKLTAAVTPEEWSGDLTWSSTDPAVITVNEFGDVTPIAPGTAYAVATVTHGQYEFSARCRVDVTQEAANWEVTGVQLGTTALTAELFRTDYAEFDVILQLKQNLMQSQARTVFSAPGAQVNNGVSIDDARFENEKAAALFDLVVKDDRTLLVVPKEEAINNPKTVAGKYVSKVIVNVDGKEFVTDASLTLTVKKSTPKLKAAALTFNTFYTGQSQAIQITGATVTDIESKSRPEWLMLENGVLKLAENAPAKASGKVTVRVKTAEWVDNISIDLTIPVKTAYAAPKLKLSASTITLPTFANPDDYGYYAGGQWLQLLCAAKGDTLERLNVAYIEAPSGWYIQEDSEGWFWLQPNAGRQISAGKITLKVHFSNTDSVVPLTLTVKTKNTPIMIITPDYLHSAKLNSRIEDGFFLRNLTSNAWLNWEQYDLDLKILDKYGNNVVGSMFYVSDDLDYICTLPGITKAGAYRMTLDLRDFEGNLRTEKSCVVTITVLPASTKPSVSVKALDAIDYTFSDNPRTRLQFTFKNFQIRRITNMYYSVTLGKEDMTDQFDLYYDDSVWSWVLKPKGEVPTGSYTLKLDACMDEQHPEEVIYSCSVKITVKRTPVKLKLSKTSLSLNKTVGDYAVLDVSCLTKGYELNSLVWPAEYNGNKAPLRLTFTDGKLTVATNGDNTLYGSTYTIPIRATDKDTAVNLTVKIPDLYHSAVTASLKAAGAIDVVRDSTAITVTPAYKNYMGLSEINPVLTIESWSGKKGEDYQPVAEGLFGITPNANGTFTITKVPGAEADTTLKYRAKLTFDSCAKPAYVNLAVKSGTAKVVVSNSIVLYKTDRFSRGTFRLTTADKTLNSIVKAEIKDAKYRNLFEIHSYGNGEFALGFKDNLIPAGKLPTSVALNVFCDGSDKSVATVTLKLQVR